ncbi:hypothetical protein BDV96DRAFT_593136 [Lophiotrema nucula]|uniref:BTB domain-containing protein n=1 Tax=Lophiotrema nucula TaxID=690887 RepID=A0A6A5ZTN1_9PLEO|nr:hypothetical protein BDV96DRAFT_593136 [Lophiotrema nucula]
MAEPRLLHNRFGTKIITVEVDQNPARQTFTVHENLIRKSSAFFEAALGRGWTEARDRVVKLPEYSARAFELYMNWLYTSRPHYKDPHGMSLAEAESSWCDLLESYLLGDYLQDANFKDITIDSMLRWMHDCEVKSCHIPAIFSVKTYERTGDGSPLRTLLVGFSAWSLYMAFIKSLEDIESRIECPRLFLRDLVSRVANIARERTQPSSPYGQHNGTCHYHCHGKGPCYKAEDATL